MNPYETEKLLSEYLLFHYGSAEEVLPYEFGPHEALDFAVRVVSETLRTSELSPQARALDLGCAVGRSSFELARVCSSVIGIDFSASFIRAAESLRAGGELAYSRVDEGELCTPLVARPPCGVDGTRLKFETGDACDLRPDLGTFAVVLLANLIDRLPEPRRCLMRLPQLVERGGQLIIASPYTWLKEYTPPVRWLGGRLDSTGDPVSTFGTLRATLDPFFELGATCDLPFLIREHARKFQWSVSQVSVWRRR